MSEEDEEGEGENKSCVEAGVLVLVEQTAPYIVDDCYCSGGGTVE